MFSSPFARLRAPRFYRAAFAVLTFFGLAVFAPRAGQAAEIQVLFSFDDASYKTKGAGPCAGLVWGTDGALYGTTSWGGPPSGGVYQNSGTVFKISPTGNLTTLAPLPWTNPNAPGIPLQNSGLMRGNDGTLYGIAYFRSLNVDGSSGQATVFKVTPSGIVTPWVSVDAGNGAQYFMPAGLVQGSDGSIYGTTHCGGVRENPSDPQDRGAGTVFKITPSGGFTRLYSFPRNDGFPLATLVEGSDGSFYGTTKYIIFKITPSGALTTLVRFNGPNGYISYAGLVRGHDGNFYGTTAQGGTRGMGTVFRVTPAGSLKTLVSFNGTNGRSPQAPLVLGNDGNFYGTTYYGGAFDQGTVFRITPFGALTTLVSLNSSTTGISPAGLVQGSDGNLYGTNELWGPGTRGTVYGNLF